MSKLISEEEKYNGPRFKVTQKIYLREDGTKIVRDIVNPGEAAVILPITDNNEVPYSLNDRYKIEKLNNEEWEEVERINPEKVLLIVKKYNLDENNQYNFEINWTNGYGELEEGTYRIVKEFEEDVFYSNEFVIN